MTFGLEINDEGLLRRAAAGDIEARKTVLRHCHSPCWNIICKALLLRTKASSGSTSIQLKEAEKAVQRVYDVAMKSISLQFETVSKMKPPLEKQFNEMVTKISEEAAFRELIRNLNNLSKQSERQNSEWAIERVRQMAEDWFSRRCDREFVDDFLNEWTIRVIKYFEANQFEPEKGSGSIASNFQAFLF